ncbi:hypothetical protein [Ochrobactrum sp. MC-1LL]|uniref:hypothetical protein n=1 Tax=Ochrobactrum sp. MC-1LL TaxID=2735351 RepID=UPI00143858D0|nr:hypothetical protein [Ochrobactrum sp. MC-1LL]NKE77560.1 hypothetical protein [Ochrobactrum sp. MC-1LL]
MSHSSELKNIYAAAYPLIEQQIELAEQVAALRDAAAAKGFDWSQIKALLKAQIMDERDGTGEGKRVQKVVEKAEFACAYADMLGLANINEKNFSSGMSREERAKARTSESMDDHKALSAELLANGMISEEAHQENIRLSDGIARKFGAGIIGDDQ